jgi:cytidylate kinase
VVLLREDPRALRVRLDGPPERRVRQAMRLDQHLRRASAERSLRDFDRAHGAYIQQFYGVDIRDPALYHVVLDSTAIELEACAEVIALAARSALVKEGRTS